MPPPPKKKVCSSSLISVITWRAVVLSFCGLPCSGEPVEMQIQLRDSDCCGSRWGPESITRSVQEVKRSSNEKNCPGWLSVVTIVFCLIFFSFLFNYCDLKDLVTLNTCCCCCCYLVASVVSNSVRPHRWILFQLLSRFSRDSLTVWPWLAVSGDSQEGFVSEELLR